MAILSDDIERFIISLIDDDGRIELQRNELAQYFSCAPSQINYVLSTRFSPDKGYIIKSRRGGGGYILVTRIDRSKEDFAELVAEKLSKGSLSYREVVDICEGLRSGGVIDDKQKKLMLAAVSDKAINIPANLKDRIRAGIFREMVLALLEEE